MLIDNNMYMEFVLRMKYMRFVYTRELISHTGHKNGILNHLEISMVV